MPNSSFNEGGQFAWDATSLDLAMACPRKYYYRMIRNITPKGTSVHLLFGGIYAKALETFYLLRSQGKTLDEALHEIVHMALVLSWNHPTSAEGERIAGGQPHSFDSTSKTRYSLLRSIIWYIEEFGDESSGNVTTHVLQSGKPAVELSFALEFAPDIMYCGHLDRVVNFSGDLYWMDQKTTGGTVSQHYFNGFKPGNQFAGYSWAGRAILKTPLRSGIIDAAQIAVGFTRFLRGFITYTDEELVEWRESAIEVITRTREYTQRQQFPMNPTACGNYGGCPYRGICASSPRVREHYVAGDFITPKAWDPLEAR